MRVLLLALISTFAIAANAKTDTTNVRIMRHKPYEQGSYSASLSFGLVDNYRLNYDMPSGFEKNNVTGYPPLYAKVEYGAGKHISLAASFGYDGVQYNFFQLYKGYNNEIIRRYKTNNLNLYSYGLIAYYHFDRIAHSKRLDPFLGLGLSINSLRYSAYPQGDSTIIKTDHFASPYLKVGAKYYVTDHIGLFGDIGYDKECILSLGVTARFFKKW